MMARLRTDPPTDVAGFPAGATEEAGAVFVTGGDQQTSIRVVVRPSGTEPKVKCYIEVREAVGADLTDARIRAHAVEQLVLDAVANW